MFFVDIAINFRTYLVAGTWCATTSRSSYYLRGPFPIDLLGSFLLNFILRCERRRRRVGDVALNRQLRLLRIIKLNRLLRLALEAQAL